MSEFDLHCHSSISDGTLPPAEVVRRAAANGVRLLALTDHDDVAGIAEARASAAEVGITLVAGVEISVSWRGHQVHIVGLGLDPENAELVSQLKAMRDGRFGRAQRMAEELARLGIPGALEGAARYAGGSIIGRTHFARFLVEQGIARDVKSVFDHYLGTGKPGYVPHEWASLSDTVGWIRGAGGIAVIAHPFRYKLSSNERSNLYKEFKALGGEGIEVAYGSANEQERRDAASAARRHGFLASCGSDFHGPGESMIDLGNVPPMPEDLTPVWAKLAVAAN
ncbi:MAG: PHP domain-containing protein [Rhodocyclaceae bacterium]|nr:PHP domain-containing protein [Rhodocyclaceae bacterium]